MKLEKITHDHLLTKWLKVIIFAIIMLAPIFSVAIRCAYVVCNKNAYQSYSNTIVENQQRVGNTAVLGNGMTYQITFGRTDNNYPAQDSAKIYYTDATIDWTEYGAPSGYVYDAFTTYTNNQGQSYNIYLFTTNGTSNVYTFWNAHTLFNDVSFMLKTTQNINLNGNEVFYVNAYITKQITLDNVFDYSVNQLKNDQLFNWTQNTGVYTGVNAMTTGLGLTDGTISILITYWTLLSIIYVIIDIVLEGFVALTHMILKKAS